MTEQQPTKKQKTFHNKSNKFFRSNKKQFIEVGQKGFLATCNFREKDCVRECYNILNQYADELYGPLNSTKEDDSVLGAPEPEAEDVDITDDLQKEIDASRTTTGKGAIKHRFQVVDTGATNCVFIKTTLEDPVELSKKLIQDIAETKQQKSRYLLRLLPIEVICKANVTDIIEAGGHLFDKHFLKEGHTFSVVFNKRYNNSIKRDEIIHELAEIVAQKNIHNKVDLRDPELSIIVEVIKGLCCLSVVQGYLKYKKYNLVELANARELEPELKGDSVENKNAGELDRDGSALESEKEMSGESNAKTETTVDAGIEKK